MNNYSCINEKRESKKTIWNQNGTNNKGSKRSWFGWKRFGFSNYQSGIMPNNSDCKDI